MGRCGLPEFKALVQQLLEDWISGLMNNEKIREKADAGAGASKNADESKGSGQKNDIKQSTAIVVQQEPVKEFFHRLLSVLNLKNEHIFFCPWEP